ncbi:MAG TPA: hypothetical protein VL096_16390, partial [Pirellulaceae bacterium]|nr:hypothetical protein [Pirellulaceae bacterium]
MTNLLRRRTYFLALTSLTIATSGCGGQPAVNATAPSSAASPANSATPATASAQATNAPLTAEAPDEPRRTPATAAEAAKVLDLRKFPRMKEADPSIDGTIARLNYQAKTDSKTAYEF